MKYFLIAPAGLGQKYNQPFILIKGISFVALVILLITCQLSRRTINKMKGTT